MQRNLFFCAVALTFALATHAQNTSPYWSIAGNSNASSSAKLGTTNADPLNLTTNNATRIRIAADGKVGIGTTNPQQRLHVEGATNQAIFVSTSALGTGSGSGFIGSAKATPTAAGQRLGYFLAGSRGGAENGYNSAGIVAYSGGAWTAGASHPTYLAFETTPAGAATRAERMRIGANGFVGINTSSPAQQLHVVGNQVLEGNLYFTTGLQSIQFGNPGSSSAPMMYMFSSGTTNNDRMVIGHSPSYPTWGLRYSDLSDRFDFVSAGTPVLSVALGSRTVGINTTTPANSLHIKQQIANRAIEWEHESTTDFWTLGIGTSTLNARFEFNGVGKAQILSSDGSYGQISDQRMKQDIEPVGSVMDKVMQLKPSKYFYKDSKKTAKQKSVGFIAQEAEKVFPEFVQDDDAGYKWMNYAGFSVVAIKAIQELKPAFDKQQEEIDQLRQDNEAMKQELAELKQMISRNSGNQTTLSSTRTSLGMITPSPAKGTARIQYELPDNSGNARLFITDVLGRTVKTVQLSQSGVVNVDVSSFSSGVYNYTLSVNGKNVQTRKMTVER